ncbi:c-type cytochrome [Stieleria sp. JC731]|uniref:PVC-type heme-binding CxxCH protein n=1 Tax=Pirellulaceae TaxID=2691357 RepID=UPI001E57D693|nr:PVC-type heme-binding CxxCH protein [Stieleria sp. JC731]MCC9601186.1 c-type cytochrome [Stieleria sp. JC731]
MRFTTSALAFVLSLLGVDLPADDTIVPKLADERLNIELFAEAPDIQTPIGMAIDSQDRIFVIESHTHHPPADYQGPSGDRIKVFVDQDDDGQPDRITVFADGIQQAMNLAFSPAGDLYVVCAREVICLKDANNDGRCDQKTTVLKLETLERYAHNSLLGITFDRDGWMYVARGNTGSHAYKIEGPDGTVVKGYGDGGSVIRCRPDGTQLSQYATGFWNPFDLKFDQLGRLLLVDNDPDARGPNRLVHVVEGGDYGYKSVYGGGGNHPFQGWDGSLPGTLPSIAGTGEAPSGVIDCKRSSLPLDYGESVLVTIWNENSIERFDLASQGSSIGSTERVPFLTGGKEFRPVAIDCDSRGIMFVTDWVLVNYPNHGRGRIWRITNQSQTKLMPKRYFDPIESGRISDANESNPTVLDIANSLQSSDAFERHDAIVALSQDVFAKQRFSLLKDDTATVRLGALLAIRRSAVDVKRAIQIALQDDDQHVRIAALMAAGESLDKSLRMDIDKALVAGAVSPVILETYLAAVENLTGSFSDNFREQKAPRSNTLERSLPEGLLFSLVRDQSLPSDVRALIIAKLSDTNLISGREWFDDRLQTDDDFALAILRRISLAEASTIALWTDRLVEIAFQQDRSVKQRSTAVFALRSQAISNPERFFPLLHADDENLAIETARTVRFWADQNPQFDLNQLKRQALSDAVIDRLHLSEPLSSDVAQSSPKTVVQWQTELAEGGDAERGRRVFFSESVSCRKCHTLGGRGGTLGPDLGGLARSRKRNQIVESILDPSAEFAPQYQAWMVLTVDGTVHRGLQLDHKAGGKINMTLEDGSTKRFSADEIEDYIASPTSLMPQGLEANMTVEELRDLVAFLLSPFTP